MSHAADINVLQQQVTWKLKIIFHCSREKFNKIDNAITDTPKYSCCTQVFEDEPTAVWKRVDRRDK